MKTLIAFFLTLNMGILQAAEKDIPVRAVEVKQAIIQQELPLTGIISAQRISSLSSRVDALVLEVLVEAGDAVKKGDILIRLDDVMADFDVKRSAAALEEAKAQLQDSIRRRDELGKLLENQYMARSSYDTAASEVRINNAIVKRLQVEYKSNIESSNRHVIKAPYNGIISAKTVEAGQWIKVGDPVLELVDIETLRVEVQVPQRYFLQLPLQAPVNIYPDALPDQPITASITRKIPVASRSAHTFPVHIVINNKKHQLTPGMTTRVVFQLASPQQDQAVLLIPRDAIIRKPNQPDSVWLIKTEQKLLRAYPVTVATGRIDKQNIEVLKGQLQQGDKIIIRGNETLKPGQLVRLVP